MEKSNHTTFDIMHSYIEGTEMPASVKCEDGRFVFTTEFTVESK